MIYGIKLKGFSNYWIFPDLGMIWSIKSKKWIGGKLPSGYLYVWLAPDSGKEWQTCIHRVIWTAVYGDIPEGMQVNHIDEDKSNNCIYNLNLMTAKENINYGSRTAKQVATQTNDPNRSKPVERCDLDGNVKERFASLNEVRRCGYNQANVWACCEGIRKTHKGSTFRWAA